MAGLGDQVRSLRATRAYVDRPLDEQHLLEILDSGRWTGSSLNSQPWTFIVVTDADAKLALSQAGRFASHLASAAAVVVLVGAAGRGEFDVGRAAQSMMLVAESIGVGSCPATMHDQRTIRHLLRIPEDRSARHVIAFGYPDHDLERTIRDNMKLFTGTSRKPLDEVVIWDVRD